MEERIWHRFYDEGVAPSLEYSRRPLPENLRRAAREHPDSPAVVFLNRRMSYRELEQDVNRFAKALTGLGVRKGSKVAVHMPNLPQTVIATQAVLALGAVAVMTNPLYVRRELEHQWNDSGCEVAVTMDFLFEQKLRGMRDKLPVQHYVIASIPEYLRFPLNLLAPLKLKKTDPPSIAKVESGAGIHFFREMVEGAVPDAPAAEIAPGDIALLQYTGGTTGVSKGAMLTHGTLGANVEQVSAWFTSCVPGEEVVLAALPYFHIFGMTVAMLWPIYEAAAMVLMPNPRDLPQMVKNIDKHRVTLLPAVPAMFNAINHYPGVDGLDLTSVKACVSGSAPLPEDVQERFESMTRSRIVEGFGLTETSPVTHSNPLNGKRKLGSIGIPLPDTDARVVDVHDGAKEMPHGEEGELLLSGPQVMKGYWNRPSETAGAIRDGWLYTGDLATMDDEGFFRIVGRKKDMIKASGYNVYPDEIDRVLMAHDAVLEACTVGIPDEKRGETVKAFVVLKPGEEVTAEELESYCKEELAAYKVPDLWEFREELPKSAMMKLLRRVLRDEEEAKLAAAARTGAQAGAAGS